MDRLLGGDRVALARAMSLVENGAPTAVELLDRLYPRTGAAFRIGVTGPPGAGKSTIVSRLVTGLWEEGKRIGVVAVDPSSPFTRGALLGDRVRFHDFPADAGLFVRSMASRGSPGGLAFKTGEVCDLLDASGKEIIIVETVGVGQSELDVASSVHTTIVVLVPESGDEVQAMKAGLMEIGDIFVVNKADRMGAEKMARGVEEMLRMSPSRHDWNPPVVLLSALSGDRVDDLLRAIEAHRSHLATRGLLAGLKRERAEKRIHEIVEDGLREVFWSREGVGPRLGESLKRIARGRSSPYREASELLREYQEREGGE